MYLLDSLISPSQNLLIWSVLLAISLFGMYGERIGWFRKVSGALMTILAGAILVSVGLIPPAFDASVSVSVYDWIGTYFIPLAIPLLLFNVQLKKIIRGTGRLLLPFLIGSLGVVLGALLAHYLLNIGEESYKVAGTFIGTYTGGSANFMAVATSLDFVKSPLFASAITVDNVFTNVYIILLFLMPGMQWISRFFPDYQEDLYESKEVVNQNKWPESPMEAICLCLLISAAIFVIAKVSSPWISEAFNTDINFEVLVITLLIIVLVNIFPKFFEKNQFIAFDLGMFFLYVFLAVIGAASNLLVLISTTPGILAFAAIVLFVHLLVSLIGGKLLNVSLEEIMIASCANAAGPSVAAPMAASFGIKKAVSPAILIGLLGYVIGTFLGVGIGGFLK